MKNTESNMQDHHFEEEAIKFLVEDNLKAKYSKLLSEEYQMERRASKHIKLFPSVIKVAATILVLAGSFVLFTYLNKPNAYQMAASYAKETNILGNQDVMRKGDILVDQLRLDANAAFVNKKYDEAISAYEKLKSLNSIKQVDIFYLSISYLKTDKANPQAALLGLNQIHDYADLYHEILWFKALGSLMIHDKITAEKLLVEIIKNGKYKSEEAKILLSTLN